MEMEGLGGGCDRIREEAIGWRVCGGSDRIGKERIGLDGLRGRKDQIRRFEGFRGGPKPSTFIPSNPQFDRFFRSSC
jgi:hypothetical protein